VPQLPNVPTIAEGGIAGFESTGWFGLVAPSRTPKIILDKIYDATIKAVKSDAMQKSLEIIGLTAVVNTQKQFAEQIQAESVMWEKVIKGRKIQAR
jgi:tripartite-type tricarboxylate transporter receptor subunit TctC